MISGHSGSGLKSATAPPLLVDLPNARVSLDSGVEPAREPRINSGSRPAPVPGPRASAPKFHGKRIERHTESDDLVLAASFDQARYRIRLLGPDDQAGSEIPLRSIDVAGALREVHLHSPDSSGFELWRGCCQPNGKEAGFAPGASLIGGSRHRIL